MDAQKFADNLPTVNIAELTTTSPTGLALILMSEATLFIGQNYLRINSSINEREVPTSV